MDMKLELVPVPVTDVDRAKAFYTDNVGFTLDVDVRPTEGTRVVQLTPPGSACSIVIGTGLNEISDMTPGTQNGLHLVVPDIDRARDELIGRGVPSPRSRTSAAASSTRGSPILTATQWCCKKWGGEPARTSEHCRFTPFNQDETS